MAKLTVREIWAVAKDEPLYRWAAAIIAIFGLIWLASWFASVFAELRGTWRMMDRRPIPSAAAVYRLDNGRCVSFASLPPGWKPGPGSVFGDKTQKIPSGVSIWKDVDGVPFISIMTFEDGRRLNAEFVTDRRLPVVDHPPYKAWRGVDGATIFLNGEKENYSRYLWCSTPDDGPRKRRVPTCDLHEDQTDPPGVSTRISFPMSQMPRADAVIAEAKAVLRGLEHSCEGAIAPPS